ncbi:hypothetical protein QVD17_31995 [Tagetes erecta]|uniref:Band 7 domain-containing protein n=1 Tax=Tagetes erecta TaxID=13708 RepID=A0AAD8NPR7_TARER|nr:hypothetical protein QVD17_31995 [Tagetes erecta]
MVLNLTVSPYDNIRHEINKFCSVHFLHEFYTDMFNQIGQTMKEALQVECTRYAPAIDIININVSKPTIPKNFKPYYEHVKKERTKVCLLSERQRVDEIEAQIEAYIIKIETALKLAEENTLKMQEIFIESLGHF